MVRDLQLGPPGRECRHNQLYWAQGQYRGIGCAAHSHAVMQSQGDGVAGGAGVEGARRWWNVRTPERYVRLVESGQSAESAGRTWTQRRPGSKGFSFPFGPATACRTAHCLVGPMSGAGVTGGAGSFGRLVLTPRGRLLANEVAMRLRT